MDIDANNITELGCFRKINLTEADERSVKDEIEDVAKQLALKLLQDNLFYIHRVCVPEHMGVVVKISAIRPGGYSTYEVWKEQNASKSELIESEVE
jgi:hypothetical protein